MRRPHRGLIRVALIGVAALALATRPGATPDTQQARDLIQQAHTKETIDGDVRAAIALYQQAVTAAGSNRALAAEALLDLAKAYDKLDKVESRKRYEQIVRDYADQTTIAAAAKARLGDMDRAAAPKDNRLTWIGPKDADVDGRISRDGRYVPIDDTNGDLVLHDLITGADRRLTNAGEKESFCDTATFSPDGRQVAYNWCVGDRTELRAIRLAGGPGIPTPRALLTASDVDWVSATDWSPDGKWLAATVSHTDKRVEVALIPTAGGAPQVLRTFDGGFVDDLAFSPDGGWLAFDRRAQRAANRQIFAVSLEDRHEVSAVTSPGDDEVIGWWRNGTDVRLVFDSDQVGARSIWTVPFSNDHFGPSPTFAMELGRRDVLGLTDDGKLYTDVCACFWGLQTATIDYTAGRVVGTPVTLASVMGGAAAAWSNDGKFVSYISDRGRIGGRDLASIVIRAMDSGERREVRPSLLPNLSQIGTNSGGIVVLWAKDDRSLIMTGVDLTGAPGYFRVDLQTGETHTLATYPASPDEEVVRGPRLSPDGKTMYYRSGTPERFTLTKLDLSSGAREEIYAGKDFGAFMTSPDFQQVVIVTVAPTEKEQSDPAARVVRITLMSANGQNPRELLRLGAGQVVGGAPLFSPDGRQLALLVVDTAAKTAALTLVTLATGETRVLMSGGTPMQVPGMWWSADGRSMLFRRRESDHWQMWYVPTDGREPHPLGLPLDARLTFFAQQPGGQQIVFDVPPEPAGDEVWELSNFLQATR